jgi:hypothetical protein
MSCGPRTVAATWIAVGGRRHIQPRRGRVRKLEVVEAIAKVDRVVGAIERQRGSVVAVAVGRHGRALECAVEAVPARIQRVAVEAVPGDGPVGGTGCERPELHVDTRRLATEGSDRLRSRTIHTPVRGEHGSRDHPLARVRHQGNAARAVPDSDPRAIGVRVERLGRITCREEHVSGIARQQAGRLDLERGGPAAQLEDDLGREVGVRLDRHHPETLEANHGRGRHHCAIVRLQILDAHVDPEAGIPESREDRRVADGDLSAGFVVGRDVVADVHRRHDARVWRSTGHVHRDDARTRCENIIPAGAQEREQANSQDRQPPRCAMCRGAGGLRHRRSPVIRGSSSYRRPP